MKGIPKADGFYAVRYRSKISGEYILEKATIQTINGKRLLNGSPIKDEMDYSYMDFFRIPDLPCDEYDYICSWIRIVPKEETQHKFAERIAETIAGDENDA